MESFEQRLRGVDWNQYSGPEFYHPLEVIDALIELSVLDRPDDDNRIYNRVLYAMGNNHSGTYYPAILEGWGFIVEIALRFDRAYASGVAREVLFDLAYFRAEPGRYTAHSAEDIERFVRQKIPR